ncbi:MAG TPA: hypothetical protein PKY31_04870 [Spirochaetota bacterium]|nr:hypothetical protein [Spirochaetota bacterium]
MNNGRIRKNTGMPARVFVLFLAIIFALGFHVVPAVQSITVEEQAGKKAGQAPTFSDEFSQRVPERRDSKVRQEQRDPRLACLLSLMLPGGGQIYLREDLKGAGFCLLTGAAYGVSGYYLYQAFQGDYEGTEKKTKLVVSGLFFVVGAIIHVVGIVEAYNDAVEINQRNYYYGSSHSTSPYIAELVYE